LVVLAGRLKAMGFAPRTKMRDRRRSMASRAHATATWLRRRSGEAKEEVLAITAEMAKLAEAALADARAVAESSARALRRQGEEASGKAKATLKELKETAALLDMVVSQARRCGSPRRPDTRPYAAFEYLSILSSSSSGVM
jgi:IS5 family transposase